jgi:hypothetical protein
MSIIGIGRTPDFSLFTQRTQANNMDSTKPETKTISKHYTFTSISFQFSNGSDHKFTLNYEDIQRISLLYNDLLERNIDNTFNNNNKEQDISKSSDISKPISTSKPLVFDNSCEVTLVLPNDQKLIAIFDQHCAIMHVRQYIEGTIYNKPYCLKTSRDESVSLPYTSTLKRFGKEATLYIVPYVGREDTDVDF